MGRKDDSGKEQWDLLPLGPIKTVVGILTNGAKRYGEGNWKKLPRFKKRYYSAAMRHLSAWKTGERNDNRSGRHHLGHAVCNLIFIMWEEGER